MTRYYIPKDTTIYRYQQDDETARDGQVFKTRKPVTYTDADCMDPFAKNCTFNTLDFHWFRLPLAAAPWKMIAVYRNHMKVTG